MDSAPSPKRHKKSRSGSAELQLQNPGPSVPPPAETITENSRLAAQLAESRHEAETLRRELEALRKKADRLQALLDSAPPPPHDDSERERAYHDRLARAEAALQDAERSRRLVETHWMHAERYLAVIQAQAAQSRAAFGRFLETTTAPFVPRQGGSSSRSEYAPRASLSPSTRRPPEPPPRPSSAAAHRQHSHSDEEEDRSRYKRQRSSSQHDYIVGVFDDEAHRHHQFLRYPTLVTQSHVLDLPVRSLIPESATTTRKRCDNLSRRIRIRARIRPRLGIRRIPILIHIHIHIHTRLPSPPPQRQTHAQNRYMPPPRAIPIPHRDGPGELQIIHDRAPPAPRPPSPEVDSVSVPHSTAGVPPNYQHRFQVPNPSAGYGGYGRRASAVAGVGIGGGGGGGGGGGRKPKLGAYETVVFSLGDSSVTEQQGQGHEQEQVRVGSERRSAGEGSGSSSRAESQAASGSYRSGNSKSRRRTRSPEDEERDEKEKDRSARSR
ncbi:hypothetical protein C8F01DRAFT_1329865 [Mycena amicta]|nr:hypothetical protein C8F01DRAFT_1329865 [Mycena amicta]